jgi:hypothetical protein
MGVVIEPKTIRSTRNRVNTSQSVEVLILRKSRLGSVFSETRRKQPWIEDLFSRQRLAPAGLQFWALVNEA